MQELVQVKEQIQIFVTQCNNKNIVDLFNQLPDGKMLRSKLILKIAGINKESIILSAIVEMIHTASLLHDDVLDDSNTRRDKPTINSIYGNKVSIMFGDVLYSKAFSELTKIKPEISYEISNAVVKLSIGEMIDTNLTLNFNTSYDTYMDMIYKKTASLIEACSKCAAIIANKNKKNFGLYGKNLGLAFQMIDDILDITSQESTLGKPTMSDFKSGKVTIPYIILWNKINTNDKIKLKNMYKKDLSKKNINWIKSKMQETNCINDSIKIAQKLGQEAINSIQLDENVDLKQIMESMINRNF